MFQICNLKENSLLAFIMNEGNWSLEYQEPSGWFKKEALVQLRRYKLLIKNYINYTSLIRKRINDDSDDDDAFENDSDLDEEENLILKSMNTPTHYHSPLINTHMDLNEPHFPMDVAMNTAKKPMKPKDTITDRYLQIYESKMQLKASNDMTTRINTLMKGLETQSSAMQQEEVVDYSTQLVASGDWDGERMMEEELDYFDVFDESD